MLGIMLLIFAGADLRAPKIRTGVSQQIALGSNIKVPPKFFFYGKESSQWWVVFTSNVGLPNCLMSQISAL